MRTIAFDTLDTTRTTGLLDALLFEAAARLVVVVVVMVRVVTLI